jgi:cytochrome c-type biogenesis protein CcmF
MTTPIGLTLLFLMAVAPVLPWRKASGELLRHRLSGRPGPAPPASWCAVLARGPGLAPLLAFGLGGFAGVARRSASSSWPCAARAGGASSGAPTAA